jgi:hypothetical protein
VPKVVLEAEFVAKLMYDALSLPNGELVHIEMALPSLGDTRGRRIVTNSIVALKHALSEQQETELRQEELQRKCDDLRQQIFLLGQKGVLAGDTVDSLRRLLEEAEEAVYGWSPNLGHAARVLDDLVLRLQ